MPERCVFSYNDGGSYRCPLIEKWGVEVIECDGLKDKQRCPFWAVVQALSRIETAIQVLEGRE